MPPLRRFGWRMPARRLIFAASLICLCSPVWLPFADGRMPLADDGALHLHRGAILGHSLAVDGSWWPRYSSALVYGYGAPLFNYFPPLAYFPSAWLGLAGLDYLLAWRLSMMLAIALAALGMFALGRRWSESELGGWAAAAAYVYAPYLVFDAVTRGASAELMALAFLPWVFLAFSRLADNDGALDLAFAIGALAIFIPLHTLISLHGAALLACFCLYWTWRAREKRKVFLRLLLASLLALALSAFYWLPALMESHVIKLDLIREQLGQIDAARHLRPLAEVFALPRTSDPTQQNQAMPIVLGVAQITLAAIGFLLCLRLKGRAHLPLMSWLGLLTLFLSFMNAPASAFLWRELPLIGYTQFPWRLLGLASMLLAGMAGIGATLLLRILPRRRLTRLGFCGCIVALMLYALPWTFAAYRESLPADDFRDAQRYERDGGQLALSSYAEYLPRSADASLLNPSKLLDRFAEDAVIARLDESESLSILSADWRGTSADLRLRSSEAQTLVFDWLYVPGWRAELSGRALPVSHSAAGLVALDLPAGDLTLKLSLGQTDIQRVASAISILALLATLGLLWVWRGRSTIAQGHPPADMRLAITMIALGSCLLLFRLSLDSADSFFRSARYGEVARARSLANFGDRIDLLAAELPADPLVESSALIKLHWRLHHEPLDKDYSSIVRLRDPAGHVIAEASSHAPGDLATRNWLPGMFIEDRISIEIPPFTPPLDQAYRFEVALFDRESLAQLSLMNAAGDPQDASFAFASRAYRPRPDLRREERESLPTASSATSLADLIEEPNLPRRATVGDELRFSWAWRKLDFSETDFGAQLLWLNDQGEIVGARSISALVAGYAFDRWNMGEANRGHHSVILPPTLQAGEYALGLRLIGDGEPVSEIMPLSRTMMVTAPQRDFDRPDFALADIAAWDNGIALAGVQTRSGGLVDLAWRTERTLEQNLRLFVHALDAEARIAAQWDGVPVDWTRPTTGWLPGEFVLTRHRFDLPTGDYRLRLGWVRPLTGERVGIGEADSLILEEPLIVD